MHMLKLIFVLLCLYYYENSSTESIYYIDTERPMVTYVNQLYLKYVTMSARRLNRKDPRHYLNVSAETLIPFNNNIRMDFYFYQFTTYRYRPSFVELHFGFCDFLDKEQIMGAEMKRKGMLVNLSCPYPAGQYNFTNMAIPFVPKNLAFQRGRIYANMTLNKKNGSISIVRAYIDMEIKQLVLKKEKP